jgi:hypothetical protein
MDLQSIKKTIDDINLVLSYKYYIIAAYVLVISCILFVIYMFLNYSFIYIVIILLNIGIFVGLYLGKSYIQATVTTIKTSIDTQLNQLRSIPENMMPEEVKKMRDELIFLITKATSIIDEILGILNILMGITVFFTLYCVVMIGMMSGTSTNVVNTARVNNRPQILQGGKRRQK